MLYVLFFVFISIIISGCNFEDFEDFEDFE